MTTHMVRKQIYIQKRQQALLKRISRARGLSEAEIIRQAIDREIAGTPVKLAAADHTAWQELIDFVESRQAASAHGTPYQWNREEIYAERENRWLREKKQD